MGKLLYEDVSERIIGAAIEVHKVLGPGFLEGVYEEALCIEFDKKGVHYVNQQELKIPYKEVILRHKYRADFVVEDKIIVEIKATSSLTAIDKAQIFNYLKATGKKVGLLMNFGEMSLDWERYICESYFLSKHRNR